MNDCLGLGLPDFVQGLLRRPDLRVAAAAKGAIPDPAIFLRY